MSKLGPGEREFLSYLGDQGFMPAQDQHSFLDDPQGGPERCAVYHQRHGRHNPDFTLYVSGEAIGAIELEDFAYTTRDEEFDERCKQGVIGHDPYPLIRKKLNHAIPQLSGLSGMPGLIVLRDWTRMKSLGDLSVLGALFGNVAMEVRLGASRESRSVFGENGILTNANYEDRNRKVSAVGVYRRLDVAEHREGVRDAMERESSGRGDIGEMAYWLGSVTRAARREGIQEQNSISLRIYLNPFAVMRWAEHLWGEYDQVLEYDSENGGFKLVKDGLAPLRRLEVAKSDDQMTLEALMKDPALRCD